MSLHDDYPDGPERRGRQSPKRDAELAAAEARFQAEVNKRARCRCGLLEPCSDCLPTSAVDFAAQRMQHGTSMVTGDDR